ncbi:MAG: AraC family transcriptional regulator [Spirochaetota bacterium]
MSKKDIKERLLAALAPVPSKAYFAVTHAYDLTVPKDWLIIDRVVDEGHILFVRSGNGRYIAGGKVIALTPGKVILIFPHTPYSAYPDLKHRPSIIPIRFTLLDRTGKNRFPARLPPVVFTPTRRFAYQELFESIHTNFVNARTSEHAAGMAGTLMHILISMITRDAFTSEDAGKAILTAKRYIDRNPAERISIAALAKKAGCSRKRFTRSFLRQFGTSPKAYAMNARMRYARYLIEQTEESIASVARTLHYTDQYVFSKQFKSNFGVPPSACRAHHADQK